MIGKHVFFFLTAICIAASGQDLAQMVRGRVVDKVSGGPLVSANIHIVGPAGEYTAISDERGNFSVGAAPGRYRMTVTFTGYGDFHDELLVISGRENVVGVALDPRETLLEAVEVQSSTNTGDLPGMHSLSIEKTLRVPANFFDPVRLATAYPGVVAANDQSNAIVVRGNSPNGLLWKLNGLDIVNPNHLSNAGVLSDRPAANGGGVNIVSAQMLDRTDFYFGAVPPQYGNAIAGVIDMKFREGNRERNEFTAQASLIGLDVSAEGPVSGNKSSFLANYRYSTVGVLSLLGVNFGDEEINFQDFSFNTSFDAGEKGRISLFGLWGLSRNVFEKKDSAEWEEEKDRYDIRYQGETYGAGLNYAISLPRGRFLAGAAYSASGNERRAVISSQIPPFQRNLLIDDFETNVGILSTNVRYQAKAGANTVVEGGITANYQVTDVDITRVKGCLACPNVQADRIAGEGSGLLLQPFAGINSQLSKTVDLEAAVRYVHFTYNGTDAIEPRVALTLRPGTSSGLKASYGLVSQLQLPQVYLSEGNSDLALTRSHHADISYWQHLTPSLNLRAGLFYQGLFDTPVSPDQPSFSMINVIDELPPGELVNEGTGTNYGADVVVEKFFYSSTYMLVGASYYESKYRGFDEVERDTRFNGKYTVSTVYGKEWLKPSRNRTIGLNARLLYLGGMKHSRVDLQASKVESETVYDDRDPFSNRLADYFRIDMRLSFRKNKPGYTRTFAIDVQNLTGHENEASYYYDAVRGGVTAKTQLGIVPILVYRIDF